MKSLNNNKYTLACVICLLIAIISIIYVSNVVPTLKSELALKEHNEKRVCHKSMAHPLLCYLLHNPRSIVAYSKKGII